MSDLPPQLAPFPDSTTVGEAGIAVGGVSLAALAAEYGTPLYVYDASTVQQRAKSVVDALTAAPAGSRAAFALKSLSTLAVLRLIHAFEDTWRWDEAAARAYQEALEAGGSVSLALLQTFGQERQDEGGRRAGARARPRARGRRYRHPAHAVLKLKHAAAA